MSISKQEACDYLKDLAERLKSFPVTYQCDGKHLNEIAANITTDFGVDQERVDAALRKVKSDKYDFRKLITDRTELLGRVCDYADILADRRRTEPWVIMQEIFGQGAGVSNAIFQLYRKER